MDHTPESHLQQSAKLAWQAAAQMKKAATLAEQAAQLLQKALALSDQEHPSQPPAPVQMSIGVPKSKKKPHVRPETTRLIESTVLQQSEHPTRPASMAECAPSSPPENTWDDGDNWWKPLQPTPPSDTD